MANSHSKKWKLALVVSTVVIAAAAYALKLLQQPELPPGIASGNGRTEATEDDWLERLRVYIATEGLG